MNDRIDLTLRETFGHGSFRSGQRELIDHVLAGRDIVAVMPTGSGKSLCYQLPAVLLEGTTVVVSPLIALMKDQLDGLRKRGVAAAAIHSGLPASSRSAAQADLAAGRLRLVYIAPERLSNRAFCDALARARVARLIVDEAHCISQWGHDFRPDYLRLGGLRSKLDVPVAGFTATATPEVRADIVRQLGLRNAVELVTGFERPNLTLTVESCRTRTEKAAVIERVLEEVGPPGIIYAATRKNAEAWTEFLEGLGVEAGTYHAGLGDDERRRTQDRFIAGRTPVIVATNAFGMGVDKPDIRFVIHADLPGSVEAYYQEVGRAGRDGLPSRCSLLFSPADVRTQEFFLAGSNPSEAVFRFVWHLLGEGLSDPVIEARAGGADAAQGMATVTALRLLRRAAESSAVHPGKGEPPIDMAARDEKARRDRERLETMVRYAFGRGCRTHFIYDYFAGSARGGAPRCGTCDVCLGWRKADLRAPDDREYLQVRIALSAVARLSGRFGAVRIAQVLVGSEAREVLRWGLHRIPTYGKLSDCSLDEAKELLHLLADSGLVERRTVAGGRPGAFVLSLTEEGRSVMQGEARPDLPLPPLQPRRPGPSKPRPGKKSRKEAKSIEEATSDPEADPSLLALLKKWRLSESHRRKVPAYVVFPDKTLSDIAALRPQDHEALLGIKGLGPAKLARYGDAVLEIVRNHLGRKKAGTS